MTKVILEILTLQCFDLKDILAFCVSSSSPPCHFLQAFHEMSVVTSHTLIPVELTNIHSVSWIPSKAQRFRFMNLPFNAHYQIPSWALCPTLLARSQRNEHFSLEARSLGTTSPGTVEEALEGVSPTCCSKHGHPGQTTQFHLENSWRMKSFWNHCCSRL